MRIRYFILVLSFVSGGFQKSDTKVLEDGANGQTSNFLVKLRGRPDLRNARNLPGRAKGKWVFETLKTHAVESQKDLISFLRRSDDVVRFKPYFISNVISVEAKLNAIQTIEQFDSVEKLVSNRPFKVDLEPPDKQYDQSFRSETLFQWNLEYIGAVDVWQEYGARGEGTRYANADTGVQYDHKIIKDNYAGYDNQTQTYNHNYAWFDGVTWSASRAESLCGVQSQVPCDDSGHGTHTISTSVGSDGFGVAPKANWIACKNMDQGWGRPEFYIACYQFLLAPTDLNGDNPDPDRRPHAVGNSYGCPDSEGCALDDFSDILETLKDAGIFMAVSAGNSGGVGPGGCGTVEWQPAIEKTVMSVGATDYQSDECAYFSSRGPAVTPGDDQPIAPDIMAPGVFVIAAYPPDTYAELSGTSMSCPHIGAAVLLITQVCPSLEYDVDRIKQLIQDTATPLFSTQGCGGDTPEDTPNNEYGYGLINVKAAVDLCYANEKAASKSSGNEKMNDFSSPSSSGESWELSYGIVGIAGIFAVGLSGYLSWRTHKRRKKLVQDDATPLIHKETSSQTSYGAMTLQQVGNPERINVANRIRNYWSIRYHWNEFYRI